MEPNLRIEALDRSVRVALAYGGEEDDLIVTRASAFYDFLTKE